MALFYVPDIAERWELSEEEAAHALRVLRLSIGAELDITDGKAKTLLIRGGERMTKSSYGNASDDLVEEYDYDYYYVNEKDLDTAEHEFAGLLASIISAENDN